ncbi:DNA-binding transcriptional regulator, GntR family [Nonomuraea solani]|uniref:DNA-binding transcriptional regulator, GntR family n=1 Tax=Nonomuraea solani TaxID=1144553 RepID=A0A1H5ZDR6_9ACTN|nr:GntR family transcriptional regulator [Nonomuraea solani]SEG34558.1 DNA-binding transcriptional regulator, GntR family [Nonomuraea solani]
MRIEAPPSMVQLATEALMRMLLGGRLQPGDRVVENQLTQQLGVSRPPLREAMRVLEQQGLITQLPRRGAFVTRLTLHDIYEIVTLRRELERMAVDLGVPVREQSRLERCHAALDRHGACARSGDWMGVLEQAVEFHSSVIGLSGHRRLEEAYRSIQLQMLLCMGMNRQVRASGESLVDDWERHRRLLEVIEAGSPEAVHLELARHGDMAFLDGIEDRVGGHSPESLAWLKRVREGDT